jgi:hypothetical protein
MMTVSSRQLNMCPSSTNLARWMSMGSDPMIFPRKVMSPSAALLTPLQVWSKAPSSFKCQTQASTSLKFGGLIARERTFLGVSFKFRSFM